MSTFNCPRCNHENDSDSAVCENCGLRFGEIGATDQLTPEESGPLSQDRLASDQIPNEPESAESTPPEEQGEDETDYESVPVVTADDLDDWLRGLPPPTTVDISKPDKASDIDKSLPTWLQEVRITADQKSPLVDPGLSNWLSDLDEDEGDEGESDDAAEWVSALTGADRPSGDDADEFAEWYEETARTDELALPQTAELPGTDRLEPSKEMEGIPEQLVGESLPEWLLREAESEHRPESADYRPDRSQTKYRKPDEETITEATVDEKEAYFEDDIQLDLVEEAQIVSERTPSEPAQDVVDDSHSEDPDDVEQWEWLDKIEDELVDEELVVAEDEPFEEASQEIEEIIEESVIEQDEPEEPLSWPDRVDSAEIMPEAEIEIDDELEKELTQTAPLKTKSDWLDFLDQESVSQVDELETGGSQDEALDLEPAHIPDWMQGIQPAKEPLEQIEESQEPAEEHGPLAGLRGVIPLGETATGSMETVEPKSFEIPKEQQQQIKLLKRLTTAEKGVEKEGLEIDDQDASRRIRMILGIILLVIVFAGWFVPTDVWPSFITSKAPTIATDNVYAAVDEARGETILVAFEYTPVMAGELDVIADSLLARINENGTAVVTVSQSAPGVVMAKQALERSEVAVSSEIGLLPGNAVGLRGLGSCIGIVASCGSMTGLSLDSEIERILPDVALMIILTSDRDSLVDWLEQVGTQSDVPIVAGLTQSLVPVAAPYLESEQLVGVVNGSPAVIAYDAAHDRAENQGSQFLTTLTFGQWLFVTLFIIGAIYFGLIHRSNKRPDDLRLM